LRFSSQRCSRSYVGRACRAASFALSLLAAAAAKGEYIGAPPSEKAAVAEDGFVTASILTISPGSTMYSLVGHTAFRLRTRDGRDICFSYEAEEASQRVLSYLAGRLRMGMFAVPKRAYLESFRGSGRTVRENVLNLSPEARLRLWQALDRRAREGIDLPYDYLSRGCAKTSFKMLCDAAGADLRLPELSARYDRTMREMFLDAMSESPWSSAFITGITGTDVDACLPRLEKVFLPADLLAVLSAATYRGRPLLGPSVILAEEAPWASPRTIDPLCVALAFFALVCLLRGRPGILVPIVQAVPGIFLVYLVFFSAMPSTGWNWLLVPFNPLPLCMWKFVKRPVVSRVLGVLLLVWAGAMYFGPHHLAHPAYLVMGLTFAVHYLLQRKDAERHERIVAVPP